MFLQNSFLAENENIREFDMKDWPKLQDALRLELPRSIAILKWIETRIAWSKTAPGEYPFKIFLVGETFQNGIITVGRPLGFAAYITVYNFNPNLALLESALLNSNIVNWEMETVIAVPEDTEEWMLNIMKKLRCDTPRVVKTQTFVQPPDVGRGMKLELPEDVYLAPLKQADVDIVNKHWLHEYEGCEDYLKELNRLCFGLGLYSKIDNELRSWCIICEYGEFGAFHTLEQHRCKGYGLIIMKAMSIVLACNSMDSYGYILKGSPSETVTSMAGAEVVGWHSWIFHKGKPYTTGRSHL